MEKYSRKSIDKFIKQEAEKLPDMEYVAFHKEIVLESDGKTYKGTRRRMEKHPVNHARRMRRLYNRLGLEGINYYLNLFGFKLAGGGL